MAGGNIVRQAFHEIKSNPPSSMRHTKGKQRRKAQMIAIALSKARKRGARV